jgi:hypothetical protein
LSGSCGKVDTCTMKRIICSNDGSDSNHGDNR